MVHPCPLDVDEPRPQRDVGHARPRPLDDLGGSRPQGDVGPSRPQAQVDIGHIRPSPHGEVGKLRPPSEVAALQSSIDELRTMVQSILPEAPARATDGCGGGAWATAEECDVATPSDGDD